jgi:hypothetical protein
MITRQIGLVLALAILLGCAAQPDDEKILGAVERALSDDPRLHDVDVSSRRGEVKLSGTASSALDRTRAEELARGAEGVVRVSNEIGIGPAQPPAVASPPPAESMPAMPKSMLEHPPMDPMPHAQGDAPANS